MGKDLLAREPHCLRIVLIAAAILAAGLCSPGTAQRHPADSSTSVVRSGEDVEGAQDVLRRFFELLHDSLYAEAAALYGGSYSFLLEGCCPDADPDDVVYLWREGCGRCGLQCLDVREVVDWTALPDGGYRFRVKFSTDEGDLFVSGPCCGATAEEEPPDSVFWFNVLRTDEGWKVGRLPLYVP